MRSELRIAEDRTVETGIYGERKEDTDEQNVPSVKMVKRFSESI